MRKDWMVVHVSVNDSRKVWCGTCGISSKMEAPAIRMMDKTRWSKKARVGCGNIMGQSMAKLEDVCKELYGWNMGYRDSSMGESGRPIRQVQNCTRERKELLSEIRWRWWNILIEQGTNLKMEKSDVINKNQWACLGCLFKMHTRK